MTCEEHRELEREREDARRELEGLPAETPASSPAPVPAEVERVAHEATLAELRKVPNSPYPPPAPTVDEDGNLTISPNLRGGR